MATIPGVIRGCCMDIFRDDPAYCLPRLNINSDGIKPHPSAQLISSHTNLDGLSRTRRMEQCDTGCAWNRKADERYTASLDELSPCQHTDPYFSAAAFSGDIYH